MKNETGDTKVQIKLSSLWFDNNYNVKQVPNLKYQLNSRYVIDLTGIWFTGKQMVLERCIIAFIPNNNC
jgi:hypothetical protein